MPANSFLTTATLLEIFTEEAADHGGHVSDSFADGERLFVRAILPKVAAIRTDDRLQGGVALRALGEEICVHPYVFRLVCQNGAIMAHAIESRRMSSRFDWSAEVPICDVRQAIRACCAGEVFQKSLEAIRATADAEADMALNLLPMLSRLRGPVARQAVALILRRFVEEGDRSRFGLMNAVTSVARDTADPQVRWNLEELGGAIAASSSQPAPKLPRSFAARKRIAELVS